MEMMNLAGEDGPGRIGDARKNEFICVWDGSTLTAMQTESYYLVHTHTATVTRIHRQTEGDVANDHIVVVQAISSIILMHFIIYLPESVWC